MPLKEANQPCPGCQQANTFKFILDSKNKDGEFSLYECSNCGGQFFFPFHHPGGDWYEQGDTYNQKEEFKPRCLHSYHKHFLKINNLPENFSFLDLGCGTAEFLNAIKEKGGKVYGVDIDRTAINIAQHFFKLDNLQAAKIEDYLNNPPVAQLDFVSMFEVFEHTDNPLMIVEKIRPLLKNEGRLIISLPSRERIFPNLARWDFPLHHLSRWSGESLSKALSYHGFKVVKIDYINKYDQLREIFLDYLAEKLKFKQARRFKEEKKENSNEIKTNKSIKKKIKSIIIKLIYKTARFAGVKAVPTILALITYPIALIFRPKSGVMYVEAIKK